MFQVGDRVLVKSLVTQYTSTPKGTVEEVFNSWAWVRVNQPVSKIPGATTEPKGVLQAVYFDDLEALNGSM